MSTRWHPLPFHFQFNFSFFSWSADSEVHRTTCMLNTKLRWRALYHIRYIWPQKSKTKHQQHSESVHSFSFDVNQSLPCGSKDLPPTCVTFCYVLGFVLHNVTVSARIYQSSDQSVPLSLWEVDCTHYASSRTVNIVTFKKTKVWGNIIKDIGHQKVPAIHCKWDWLLREAKGGKRKILASLFVWHIIFDILSG